ncbi:ABC transporter permease [Runella zeae]|uniref:ABC transporter permease n=1 Tax=Runella zeae TaxID=94255 RepID=UPI002354768F|nr:ABC transporter permease [Runella zeae]
MHSKPPRLADRFLQFFCAPHLLEEVQGDLHEEFEYQVVRVGVHRARWRYWRDVLGFFQARYIKRKPTVRRYGTYPTTYLYNPTMLQNYFKIAFRNQLKHKGYSFINIFGLATGMAVAMLIGLWVWDELSFNTYHKNYPRIAQVVQNQVMNGEIKTSKSVPYPFINELKTNYGESFKNIIASTYKDEFILTAGETKLSGNGQFMETQAPELFTFEMQKGTWEGLTDPQSILLSTSIAKALFGDTDPMNKPLKINTDLNVKVTGIYEDFPQNSVFYGVQFVASWDYFVATNPFMKEKKWDNHALIMYVEIKPEATFEKVTAAIKDSEFNVIKQLDDMKEEAATHPQMWLHPMKDWHLYASFKNGLVDNGPVQYVWLVGMIGFFVLLLACINFMNLSTARSEKRAKEVGIRKAIGSLRAQLVGQFFGESFLVVIIAFVVAQAMVLLALPGFNELADKQMALPLTNLYFWLFSLGFILLTGLLAGSYPAFYLTSFQPVKVLKGAAGQWGRIASLPRKVLVVLQFTVSVTLVICTVVIYQQVKFAKNRPIGYSRDRLLMVQMKSNDFYGKTQVLRSELKKTGVVLEMAESQSPITGVWSANTGFSRKGLALENENFATLSISPEYAQTVGWEFVAGRNFSKAFASDSVGFIINETAARLMGFPKNTPSAALGETVHWKSKFMTNDVEKPFQIIGVVKDMVMESPFEQVKPTVFLMAGSPNWLNIKINPGVSAATALPKIEAVFKKLIPAAPFDYKFVDDEYNAKFSAEERVGKLSRLFAVLAIFISCLGLFGLALFVAEQRTKEIGIRKVLGASVAGLWQMLSKDFVVLVIISCFIAMPIAHYFMNEWLQKYTYRTEISWWTFVVTAILAVCITLLTVSFQAIKAALMNPVKSLKSE